MIDAAAVIARLRETDARSGGRREAWTPAWADERVALDALCEPSVTIERDAFANTWYVLEGDRPETVLVSGHSDCVPGGGWLDGILGVHAGLGLLAAAATHDTRRARTLAVVDWADEEGTRFGRSLLGSSAASGALTIDELDRLTADDGTAAAEIIAPYGFDPAALGTPTARLSSVVAAIELHIEQGPVLAREGRAVAAVDGCLGVRRGRIRFDGEAGHAGAIAMADRRDPVRAAARFVTELLDAAQTIGGLATVGRIEAEPAIATAVAAACELTVDLRHAQLEPLIELGARADELLRTSRCPAQTTPLYTADPVTFDERLVARAAAAAGGGATLTSGPLHDSAALARAGIPTAMLFSSSVGGVSHSREEDTPEEDLVAAIEALHRLVDELRYA